MLGALWNWTLYGVLVVQIYVYSYNFPGDRILLKLLVYSVFLVETLQTALSGADLYYWFVSGFGNIDHLTTPYESPFDVPIIGSVVALTVQIFFVYRIWVLSRRSSWFICLFICLVSRYISLVPIFYFLASQFSMVAAVAAIYGGVYVSLVHPESRAILHLTHICRRMFAISGLVAECSKSLPW
ncbi:hypothetical protein H4582DRAFT_1817399 [Lactarius indigo]|nr:hypothetical protein H4582DRAFT_1829502 [Lactarius indigo]KAI9435797.1 hypothetical protein H4582DRAFT_1817399 [Lactarius indigo]